MAQYEVVLSKKAAKEYAKLPIEYKNLVDKAFSRLEEGVPADIRSIVGETNIFRIRVGRYRILFSKEETTIIVARIVARGDAYKK